MKDKIDLSQFNLKDKNHLEAVADLIINNLKTGMTLQTATGVSPETLEEIYSLAYGYYNLGKYKESAALFQFLSSISPDTYKFVLGLASSFHQLGLFQDAAAGFYIALGIETENPVPAYYLLDCLQKLNLSEEAIEVADFALQICENKEDYREIYNRILLVKNSLVK